jgi:CheY-like chemotaxis protein
VRVEDMAGRFFMDHVLIVEDQEENRNLLKMPLEANGDRVTAAGDGLEAPARRALAPSARGQAEEPVAQ